MKALVMFTAFFLLSLFVSTSSHGAEEPGTGQLKVVTAKKDKVEVPLAHTSVKADIAGFVARVTVTQTFVNPFKEPIEAVYVFPLPHKAAVDDMTMKIGSRVIKGVIKKRDEAKKIYDDARKAGKTASLLEQERPNIFTQSVANILPGDAIEVRISYVETLKYEKGEYEFVFPMVVGPRYIPGERIIGKEGGGWAPDTNRVPDASRITPPVLKPGERSGHDIDVTVSIDGAVPFTNLRSPSHMISVKQGTPSKAVVKLDPRDTIPNKDLILRYNVLGKAPAFGSAIYSDGKEGYFLLILTPKEKYGKEEILPREILFIIDSSGSQSGDPLAKSKELMKRALYGLRPDDTFQIFNFNDTVTSMADGPVGATAANIVDARKFIDQIRCTGGTRMVPVIQAALNWPADPKRLRLVVMATDGYVGNEGEVLGEIRDNLGDARLFMFGVGSSTNRYLIDRMAEEGRGFSMIVRQDEPTDKVIETFHRRMDTPVLRDLKIDWQGLAVRDVYPARVPDLYAGQPVVLLGRFTKPGSGTVRLQGTQGSGAVVYSHKVTFPAGKTGPDQIASLWARTAIEKMMNQREADRSKSQALEKEVTNLALAYRLMTQFTSFVAVEEQIRNIDGKPRTVQVPVEMPEGVSHEGVFGEAASPMVFTQAVAAPSAPPPVASGQRSPSKKTMTRPVLPSASRAGNGGGAGKRAAALPFTIDPIAFLGITDEVPYRNTLQGKAAEELAAALKDIPLPKGKGMMVRIALSPKGAVKGVEVTRNTADSPDLEKSVKEALMKIVFPSPEKDATLVFSLKF